MEQWWNDPGRGKPKLSEKKNLVSMPQRAQKVPQRLTWD
jgi:hypothetical protein